MECHCYCVAHQINLSQLERLLRSESQFRVNRHWQVLEVHIPDQSGFYYVFSNGTLVSWNLKRYQMTQYIAYVISCASGVLKRHLYDDYFYEIGDKTMIRPHSYFNLDCLVLEADDSDLKLSLSYGFSQSMKLKFFEDRVDKLIETNAVYINELSSAGKITLSRAGMRQIVGEILAVKGDLNVTSNFSYQPKFFWQHPNLESYFSLLERYLDISQRKGALNQQLDVLNEIFDMFTSYLEEKHAHKLEIIIIVLIAIEIVFNVLNLHL
ncbi:MAG: hypothetical protein A3F10_02340 [Coxiella sp. RIFCSPHIGHO2_12_FULL_42_15]|nr:MAG: hypothetical protein A3F10_02340 [Coxiella sp. RIFCSPHIGHO2_12_FULL_42_15]